MHVASASAGDEVGIISSLSKPDARRGVRVSVAERVGTLAGPPEALRWPPVTIITHPRDPHPRATARPATP